MNVERKKRRKLKTMNPQQQQKERLPSTKLSAIIGTPFTIIKRIGPGARTSYQFWKLNGYATILKRSEDGTFQAWDKQSRQWAGMDNNLLWTTDPQTGNPMKLFQEYVLFEIRFNAPTAITYMKQPMTVTRCYLEVNGDEQYGPASQLIHKMNEILSVAGTDDPSILTFNVTKEGMKYVFNCQRTSSQTPRPFNGSASNGRNVSVSLPNKNGIKPSVNVAVGSGLSLSDVEKAYVDALKNEPTCASYDNKQREWVLVNNAGVPNHRAQAIIRQFFG